MPAGIFRRPPFWQNYLTRTAPPITGIETVGTLTATLDPLTVVAVGAALPSLTLTATLADLTSSSAVKLETVCTVSATLDTITTVTDTAITNGPTLTFAKTLGGIGLTTAVTVNAQATLNQTLGSLGLSSAAAVKIGGTLSQTLSPLGLVTATTVQIGGTLSQTLAGLGKTAQAAIGLSGATAATLAGLTATSAAASGILGTTAKTLGALTSVSAANSTISGSLVKTLDPIGLTVVGGAVVKFSAAITLGPLVSQTATNQPNTAQVVKTLDPLGKVITTTLSATPGVSTITLGGIGLATATTVLNQGSLLATLGPLVSSSAGRSNVAGTLAKALANLTSTATITKGPDITPAIVEFTSTIYQIWDTTVANPIIHKNDVGTKLRDTLFDQNGQIIDVSPATLKQVILRKPDGTSVTKNATFVTNGTDGRLEYTTVANDLNVIGKWVLQLHVTLPTGDWYGELHPFTVYANAS